MASGDDGVEQGVIEQGAVEPGAVEPGAVEPGVVEPGVVEPGAVEPGAVEPGAPARIGLVAPPRLQWSPQEIWFVVGAAVFAAVVHYFFMAPGFGEDDAARLARDSIHWHMRDTTSFAATDYRLRTSSLYLSVWKVILDLGIPIRFLAWIMNVVSVLAGSGLLVGLYVLYRRMIGRRAAAIGAVLCALAPAIWMGSTYGMPHMPAAAIFVWAQVMFVRTLDETGQRRAIGAAVVFLLMALTLCTKADFVLCGGAFVGLLVFYRKTLDVRGLAIAIVVVVGALGFALLFAGWLDEPVKVAHQQAVGDFWERWNKRFPIKTEAFTNERNLGAITHAPGVVFFWVAFAASVVALFRSARTRRLVIYAAMSTLPLTLFWAARFGNSARHNMIASTPFLMVLAAVAFQELKRFDPKAKQGLVAAVVLALVAVTNYFSDTEKKDTMVCPSHLIGLSTRINTVAKSKHDRGRKAVALSKKTPKLAVLDNHWSLPFIRYELYGSFADPVFDKKKNVVERTPASANVDDVRMVRIVEVRSPAQAKKAGKKVRAEGWTAWSASYRP